MKPLKLTIEGINSFIEPVSVNFERLQENGIFVICGATGSGKTTILDSVILALYAPRSNTRGNLRDYVNTKCAKGSVTLLFEADGARYEVNRTFYRDGTGSKARLTNLDTGEVLADKAEDANDKIQKMLKLDRDEFTRVAVLEQGKFAEFMTVPKSKRNETISKLFSLSRFEALKERMAKAKSRYEKLHGEAQSALSQYEGVTEAQLTERKREKKEAEKTIADLSKAHKAAEEAAQSALVNKTLYENRQAAARDLAAAEEALKAAQSEKGNLQARKAAAQQRQEELAKIAAKKEGASAVLHALEECRRDEEDKKKKEEKRLSLGEAYRQADARLQAFAAQKTALFAKKEENAAKAAGSMRGIVSAGYACDGSAEGFAAVRERAVQEEKTRGDLSKKQSKAEEKLQVAETLAEKLLKAEGEAKAQVDRAEKEERAAREVLERAQKENAAAAVRQLLKSGDTCPVCGGKFDGTHAAVDASVLEHAQQAYNEAQARLRQAQTQVSDAQHEQRVNAERMSAAQNEVREATAALEKLSSHASEAAKAASEGMEAAKAAVDAEKQLAEVILKIEQAQKEREAATAEGQAVRAEIDALEARIAARLDGKNFADAEKEAQATLLASQKAEEEAGALKEALQKEEQALLVKIAAATEKKESATRTLEKLKDAQFDEEAAKRAVQEKDALAEKLRAAHATLGSVESAIADLTERLSKKKELQKQKSELSEKLSDITALNKCVERDNPLLSYVADWYVQSFTATASETLSSLTDGKYTLYYEDGDFYVEDFFCDNARRKVKTLSGGETFLASVSIAMAVSREIAEKDFGFFFLDEGFGTLHEKALATVTDALYKLSRDTTVGIVTHRSELAERIPTRLQVLPATEEKGSQIVFAAD